MKNRIVPLTALLVFCLPPLVIPPALATDYEEETGARAPAPEAAPGQSRRRGYAAQPPYAQKITATLQGVTFTSDYDNGSLGGAREMSENRFALDLYTESGELGARRYWFRFRVSGAAGRTLTLEIDHSNNPRPFVRFGGEAWRRMTSAEAPSSDRVVLAFPSGMGEAEVAFFAPFGYGEILDAANALVRRCDSATSSVLGVSHLGRELWIIQVAAPSTAPLAAANGEEQPAAAGIRRRGVWVHARAHAGEATSNHVLQGFLDQITEDSLLGDYLRRHFVFHVVPVLNADGAWLGYTRWDAQGIDPERQWCDPGRAPEVAAMRREVDAIMAGPEPIEVALNLHSTVGAFADTFFFKHTQPSVTVAFEELQQRYIEALRNATPLFDNRSAQESQLALLADCPTAGRAFIESYFWDRWGERVMAMTHEGHFYRRITDNEWITPADYEEIGRAMALALIEYFDQTPLPEGHAWTLY